MDGHCGIDLYNGIRQIRVYYTNWNKRYNVLVGTSDAYRTYFDITFSSLVRLERLKAIQKERYNNDLPYYGVGSYDYPYGAYGKTAND